MKKLLFIFLLISTSTFAQSFDFEHLTPDSTAYYKHKYDSVRRELFKYKYSLIAIKYNTDLVKKKIMSEHRFYVRTEQQVYLSPADAAKIKKMEKYYRGWRKRHNHSLLKK